MRRLAAITRADKGILDKIKRNYVIRLKTKSEWNHITESSMLRSRILETNSASISENKRSNERTNMIKCMPRHAVVVFLADAQVPISPAVKQQSLPEFISFAGKDGFPLARTKVAFVPESSYSVVANVYPSYPGGLANGGVRRAMLIRSFDQQQEHRRYIVRDEQDTYVRADLIEGTERYIAGAVRLAIRHTYDSHS